MTKCLHIWIHQSFLLPVHVTSGLPELDMLLKKNTIKTFPSLWLQDFIGMPIQSHLLFGTPLAACQTPGLKNATSLLPENWANRDPIDTALTSSVKLLRINHTRSTKHTCTSPAVPEERGARERRTGSIWLLCCFSYCKKQVLEKEWGFPLAEQLWKEKKTKGILQHFMANYKNSSTSTKTMCCSHWSQSLCHVIWWSPKAKIFLFSCI